MAGIVEGWVLISPEGIVMRESFRATKDGAKGVLVNQPYQGKFTGWRTWNKAGWRCRFAVLDIYEMKEAA
jgi:hypothetical protein